MPKRDELYYVLMNINKHQHYEDCKSKLEEGFITALGLIDHYWRIIELPE